MRKEIPLEIFLTSERKNLFLGFTNKQIDNVEEWFQQNGLGSDIDSSEVMSERMAVDLFNLDLGQSRSPQELTDRYLMVHWIEELNLGDDPLKKAIGYWNDINNIPYMKPNPGAYRLYTYLHLVGIDIPRLTARPAWTRDSTLEYYRRNSPWVVEKDLLYISDNNIIDPEAKVKSAVELGLGAFIEDALEEAYLLADKGILTGLVPQSWNNRKYTDHTNVLTVNQRLRDGFKVLDPNNNQFVKMPNILQVYHVMADEILFRYF
ncbi:hypothetical protein A2863_00850 [Candidatus Woesebacteria bacterium RIFCSPHIGHO2_01_FULL_38_9b]|uniref:Uncharacterized protein n=1 Tax=Candidatus Woesebacteria bacterium RIFCSPHIGHO2_01_FULL_38_9b TaxID=1802493 RepID=A0A1F7XYT3_9BACT|nr:MAG: hypothetical protein A2863_00850 [Candidatus Woesebacteria bacterium RIFCSPHIGHO2_01_FULL_38_9b]